jgi:hypothetical protein
MRVTYTKKISLFRQEEMKEQLPIVYKGINQGSKQHVAMRTNKVIKYGHAFKCEVALLFFTYPIEFHREVKFYYLFLPVHILMLWACLYGVRIIYTQCPKE